VSACTSSEEVHARFVQATTQHEHHKLGIRERGGDGCKQQGKGVLKATVGRANLEQRAQGEG